MLRVYSGCCCKEVYIKPGLHEHMLTYPDSTCDIQIKAERG